MAVKKYDGTDYERIATLKSKGMDWDTIHSVFGDVTRSTLITSFSRWQTGQKKAGKTVPKPSTGRAAPRKPLQKAKAPRQRAQKEKDADTNHAIQARSVSASHADLNDAFSSANPHAVEKRSSSPDVKVSELDAHDDGSEKSCVGNEVLSEDAKRRCIAYIKSYLAANANSVAPTHLSPDRGALVMDISFEEEVITPRISDLEGMKDALEASALDLKRQVVEKKEELGFLTKLVEQAGSFVDRSGAGAMEGEDHTY